MAASGELTVRNVHLAFGSTDEETKAWDVHIANGKVDRIDPVDAHRDVRPSTTVIDAAGRGLLLPSFCHAHIHLDKPFLLDRCHLQTGTFQEALTTTAAAKSRFASDPADVYERGARLLRDSIAAGVTALRAHVEVDVAVGLTCLDVAVQLKHDFRDVCDVHIALFAQDPLFDSPDATDPNANYTLLASAASSHRASLSAIGSAPYIELSRAHAIRNTDLILALAKEHDLLADFHLDYVLSPSSPPQIYDLAASLRARSWHTPVALGHCTRLALFTPDEWTALAREHLADVPITLVALPHSDVYMMRVTDAPSAGAAPRGTLPLPLAARAGVRVALAVNNVANAFTPHGSADPTSLCPFGVALYQDPTPATCRLLLKSISTAARSAIGLAPLTSTSPLPTDAKATADDDALLIHPGDSADLVLLHDNVSVQDAVTRPSFARTTIRAGVVVATRQESTRILQLGGALADTGSPSATAGSGSANSTGASRALHALVWIAAGFAFGSVLAMHLTRRR